MILVGDIGGTFTRLALCHLNCDETIFTAVQFMSQDYTGLEQIIHVFLQGQNVSIMAACFGVAGPVVEGRCKTTNLPWIVDAVSLSLALKISSISLLNDLEASAYGLNCLQRSQATDLYLLQKGVKTDGNLALISAGTGLGEAGLIWDGKTHHPFSSEGGHVDFAPRNALEIELLYFLQKKFGHVSYERVVSGPGLHMMYQFFIETDREVVSKEVEFAMEHNHPVAVICKYAERERDPACANAVDLFLSLYGAEAGNTALKFLAIGGVYLGGGLIPRLIKYLPKSSFFSSFCDKGRFKDFLESIPVYVVMNDQVVLLGATAFLKIKQAGKNPAC